MNAKLDPSNRHRCKQNCSACGKMVWSETYDEEAICSRCAHERAVLKTLTDILIAIIVVIISVTASIFAFAIQKHL